MIKAISVEPGRRRGEGGGGGERGREGLALEEVGEGPDSHRLHPLERSPPASEHTCDASDEPSSRVVAPVF